MIHFGLSFRSFIVGSYGPLRVVARHDLAWYEVRVIIGSESVDERGRPRPFHATDLGTARSRAINSGLCLP